MTVKQRLAAYTAIAGMLAVLVVLGVVTHDQADATLAVVDSVLQLAAAVALVIAARRITPDSWSTIRTGIYVLTSVSLTLAGAFGILAPDIASPILTMVDSILSVVGIGVLSLAAAKVPAVEGTPYDPQHDYEDDAA